MSAFNWELRTETPAPTRRLYAAGHLARGKSCFPAHSSCSGRSDPADARGRRAARRHRGNAPRLRTRRSPWRTILALLERSRAWRSRALHPLQPDGGRPAAPEISIHAAPYAGIAVCGDRSLDSSWSPLRAPPQSVGRSTALGREPVRPVISQLRTGTNSYSVVRDQAWLAAGVRGGLFRQSRTARDHDGERARRHPHAHGAHFHAGGTRAG